MVVSLDLLHWFLKIVQVVTTKVFGALWKCFQAIEEFFFEFDRTYRKDNISIVIFFNHLFYILRIKIQYRDKYRKQRIMCYDNNNLNDNSQQFVTAFAFVVSHVPSTVLLRSLVALRPLEWLWRTCKQCAYSMPAINQRTRHQKLKTAQLLLVPWQLGACKMQPP